MRINLNGLRGLAADIVQQARYNKSLNNNLIDGLKVVAIDSTRVFTMRSERLGKNAHKYEHSDDNDEITSIDYREKTIVASYIGEGFSPIIKINRIAKGEGETTAAKKLVNELNEDYYQYCDVIVGDSLYINAPFINEVLRNNKDVVVRVKQSNNLMIKDADGLFKNRKPDHTFKDVSPQDKDKTSGTWNFDRRYSSNPIVIQSMYYLYVIAYNLFNLYIHRNLRSFDPEKETKKKF